MSVDISIIIPCYNSAAYLPEAVSSVRTYKGKHSYEIIIVDDGSTEAQTLQLLNELGQQGITILHQENKGPAAARNTGISHAAANYILFLDSDNKIRPDYIDAGIEVLESDREVGIVYGNPEFFGEVKGRQLFVSRRFDIAEIFSRNYIDICSVVRRKVWEDAGGLDENRLIIGHEDWDFWITAATLGWKFHYVNETLFDYRVREDSLVTAASAPLKFKKTREYICNKHMDLLLQTYDKLYYSYAFYRADQQNPFRSFFKYCYNKYFSGKDRDRAMPHRKD